MKHNAFTESSRLMVTDSSKCMMSYWLDQTFSRQRNNIRTLKFVDSSACLNAYTLLRNKNMGFKQIYLRYIPKGWQPLKNKPLANSRWQNTKWKQLCVMMEGFVICTGQYHINSNSAVSNIVKLLCTRNTKILFELFFLAYFSSHHYPPMVRVLPYQGLFTSWPRELAGNSLQCGGL